mgnify:CR=1 FL=1
MSVAVPWSIPGPRWVVVRRLGSMFIFLAGGGSAGGLEHPPGLPGFFLIQSFFCGGGWWVEGAGCGGCLWLGLCAVGGLLVTMLPVSLAQALTVRPMSLNYQAIVNGDYVMVGNGALACDPTKPIFPNTNFTCVQLHNATAQTNLVNDFKWMGNVDVDSNAATVNSSRATVTIPAGASILR